MDMDIAVHINAQKKKDQCRRDQCPEKEPPLPPPLLLSSLLYVLQTPPLFQFLSLVQTLLFYCKFFDLAASIIFRSCTPYTTSGKSA